jgi:PhnB protein
MFWGDRFGRVVDAQGNGWAIATHVEDVPAKDMKKRAAAAFAGAGGQPG